MCVDDWNFTGSLNNFLLKLKKFLEKKMKKNVDELKRAADQGSDEYLCFIKIILNIT